MPSTYKVPLDGVEPQQLMLAAYVPEPLEEEKMGMERVGLEPRIN